MSFSLVRVPASSTTSAEVTSSVFNETDTRTLSAGESVSFNSRITVSAQ